MSCGYCFFSEHFSHFLRLMNGSIVSLPSYVNASGGNRRKRKKEIE